MRIKRSVTRFFTCPDRSAVTLAGGELFRGYAIWAIAHPGSGRHPGQTGHPAGKADRVQANRARLEHRIALMTNNADPDLVEELARPQLMDGAPNQVAVPRRR